MNKNYIPLYRKYRPQKIEEIVGQEHVKKALTNAIELNRISHAYLFTGPRGTGKTSTARIFAKSLNCINGPTISPCNECENCSNITKSIPIDVIEIDAASNRSVSDAEDIIQKVAMAPINSRYKIYIIDEVHMLTSTAFNALLKTLEEPPQNVIFILATTEVHKVLDTIKSRCQRFDFKRITTDDIAKHLRYISDKEEINITDEALYYIAQNSAGGMRDSIALLDQLSILNSSDNKISVDDINMLLGRLSFDVLKDLFEVVSTSKQTKALDILNNIYNSGNEPSHILSNFIEYLRNALIVKSVEINDNNSIIKLNNEQLKIVKSQVENLECHQIVSLIDRCANYIKEIKQTTEPKLWLDIAIIDMANMLENTKLEDLQKRISILEDNMQHKVINTSAYNTPPSPVLKQEIKSQNTLNNIKLDNTSKKSDIDNIKASSTAPKTNTQELVDVPNSSSGDSLKTLWIKFLENISSFPSKAILKQQATPLKISKDEIIITIKNPTWLKNFSPEGERYAFLKEAANNLFGCDIKIIVRAPQPNDIQIQNTQQTTQNPQINEKNAIQDNGTKNTNDTTPNSNTEEIEKDSPSEDEPNEIDEQSQVLSDNNKYSSVNHSDGVNMVMDLFEGKIIE